MSTRSQIADRAAAVISRELDYREFEAAVPRDLKQDPLVDELLELILHEPAPVGWSSSTSDRHHAMHMKRVHEIIKLLRAVRD